MDPDIWEMLLGLMPSIKPKEPTSLEELVASPLIQDTIFELIGGRPALGIGESRVLAPLLQAGGWASPVGRVGIHPSIANTQTEPGKNFLEEILLHELGHVQKFRQGGGSISPGLFSAVARRFPELEGSERYAATSPDEHFAEAFLNAINFIRMFNNQNTNEGDERVLDEEWLNEQLDIRDKRIPGTREVAEEVSRHPLYSGSPVGRVLGGLREMPRARSAPTDATRTSTRSEPGFDEIQEAVISSLLQMLEEDRSATRVAGPDRPSGAGDILNRISLAKDIFSQGRIPPSSISPDRDALLNFIVGLDPEALLRPRRPSEQP